MDTRTKSLVAVGAAAAVNCRPCLEHLVPQSFMAGASEKDARDAIETGLQVNRGAHAKTRGFVEEIVANARQNTDTPATECCDKETAARTGCC